MVCRQLNWWTSFSLHKYISWSHAASPVLYNKALSQSCQLGSQSHRLGSLYNVAIILNNNTGLLLIVMAITLVSQHMKTYKNIITGRRVYYKQEHKELNV